MVALDTFCDINYQNFHCLGSEINIRENEIDSVFRVRNLAQIRSLARRNRIIGYTLRNSISRDMVFITLKIAPHWIQEGGEPNLTSGKKTRKKIGQNQKFIYSSPKVLKISELFCLYVKSSKMMSCLKILILGPPIPLFSKMT